MLEAVIVATMSAVMGFLLIFCVEDCTQDQQGEAGHHHGSAQVSTDTIQFHYLKVW